MKKMKLSEAVNLVEEKLFDLALEGNMDAIKAVIEIYRKSNVTYLVPTKEKEIGSDEPKTIKNFLRE